MALGADFAWLSKTSHKVACVTCGATGYPGGRWQAPHIAGHPHVCSCGRAFATASGIAAHVRLTKDPGVHQAAGP